MKTAYQIAVRGGVPRFSSVLGNWRADDVPGEERKSRNRQDNKADCVARLRVKRGQRAKPAVEATAVHGVADALRLLVAPDAKRAANPAYPPSPLTLQPTTTATH